MGGSSNKDALGELFRGKLENHEIEVDDFSWDEIESRLGKQKNKAVIRLWHYGIVAAAASVAALLYFNLPTNQTTADEKTIQLPLDATVIQQINTEATEIDNNETILVPQTNIAKQKTPQVTTSSTAFVMPTSSTAPSSATFEMPPSNMFEFEIQQKNEAANHLPLNDVISVTKPDSVTQLFSYSVIDFSLVEDRPDEDENDNSKTGKWLLAAVLGTGTTSYTNSLKDSKIDYIYNDDIRSLEKSSSSFSNGLEDTFDNDRLSFYNNLNYLSKNDFTNTQHRLPLSFGIKACKNFDRYFGVESGLVYTYLASRFEWSGYDTNQNLHYLGIPLNLVVYMGNSKSNWQFYIFGGGMFEKGLLNISYQERRLGGEFRKGTARNSINGVQWSLNGGMGVNYKFEKGWGIYFEPRMGYSFNCNQPVSIRTEFPLYFGINLGLNYEL